MNLGPFKIFLLSIVDFELLVFLLASSKISENNFNCFMWLHANIHYLGGNGWVEIRMLGFRP